MNSPTHILKFGGTSLKDASLIRQSVQVVVDRAQTVRPVVVVSAIAEVTDTLIALTDKAKDNSTNADQEVKSLRKKHLDIFDELIDENTNRKTLNGLFNELEQTLDKISCQKEDDRALTDRVLSVGERASALIFASLLSHLGCPALAFEASKFIKTDATFGEANVQRETTRKLIRKFLQHSHAIPVVTGFIGSDEQQRITTLGRSGSDYTAGLLADALDADHLEIWTDVNGVLSADPRWVATAESIEQLSFTDINELSAHGAGVMHPKTIRPITDKETTVLVKNSHNPGHPGTRINRKHESNGSFKTVTITGPFVQIQIDASHALELLDRLQQWLALKTDSEAWTFESSGVEPARFLIRQELFDRINGSLNTWAAEHDINLQYHEDLFKVKKFSNRFSSGEQFTSRIWDLLANRNLRPLQVNRNRNERFISLLFQREDTQRAARLINDYLHPEVTTVDVFLAGTGAVGSTLYQQLENIELDNIKFRLLGICNSRNTLWNEQGIDFQSDLNWSEAEKTDWTVLTERLTQNHRHNLIFVDATGSPEVARLYPRLFSSGIHVVTPSKLANTFEQSFFDRLQSLTKKHNTNFRYETTVGAGLPVISTLQNLKRSGDNIREISGVVSGTMTYLFNQIENGVPFSKAVADARDLGYAEPDPRDDLSGEDVGRKFLTLARTLGLKIEPEELQVESLIPEELAKVRQEAFLSELENYDDYWKQRTQTAQLENKVLRYTGRLKNGVISIGIETVDRESPLGQLKGTDNLIQIYSRQYHQTPLIIQGPGAGKKVTAAGVLSDISKVIKSITLNNTN